MARYLLVKIEDDDKGHDSGFARVRKVLHDLAREEDIKLSDFGTNMRLVTDSERAEVEALFERVMDRARRLQKVIDAENPFYKSKRRRP